MGDGEEYEVLKSSGMIELIPGSNTGSVSRMIYDISRPKENISALSGSIGSTSASRMLATTSGALQPAVPWPMFPYRFAFTGRYRVQEPVP